MAILILHVDDQPDLPEGFARALARDGYELVHTADAEAAIRLVDAREPALVLMDPQLARCDGIDLLAGIRVRGSDATGVPVVVLTRAPRGSALYGEVVALGVVHFLTKPALASELLAAVHELAPPPPKSEPSRPAGPAGAPELSGSLADTPMPEVLARLRRRGANGALLASWQSRRVGVQLRNGSPVAVTANGSRALAPGARSEEEIAAEIGRRAEAALFDSFAWTDGSYRFAERRRVRSDSALELSRDVANLLLAGVLEATPPEQARDRLRQRASLYASICEPAENPLVAVELTPEQERRLADLSGEGTLGELLDARAFDERLLYGLWVAGWLELHAVPTITLFDEIPAGPDEIEGAAEAGGEPPAPADEREALAHSLRLLAQRVMAGDDFEALDIPVYAPDAQVRAAYEQLLAEIPERALRSEDDELRERAERIRKRVESAYEHLKEAETRRAYALMRQEEEQDRDAKVSAPRALEAERWFRKGEALLKTKRPADAAGAFGMASHLDPGEGEYLAHLGYALYLSNPQESVVQREAVEHIANAIKRSPDRALSYVFLGRILVAQGDVETARKVFRRALRSKPDFHPALQELRLLELRERKGKGILARLWRR